ncbi:MAG: antibiotic biosynthesis monooxygenase [Flavobacteriales bacterium]|nr:antibiotic biosynthesis monooxygenase [Flavobacteriales bacterium]
MIVRLVRMTFHPEHCERFKLLFEGWRQRIIRMPGCRHLELLRDTDRSNVFVTYSVWEQAADLEAYRCSDVFNEVWPTTKALFSAPAEAWSHTLLHRMDRSGTTVRDLLSDQA